MAAAYGITVLYIESVRGYIDATRYCTSGRFNRLNNTVVERPAVPPVVARPGARRSYVLSQNARFSETDARFSKSVRPIAPLPFRWLCSRPIAYPTTGRSSRVSYASRPASEVSRQVKVRDRDICTPCKCVQNPSTRTSHVPPPVLGNPKIHETADITYTCGYIDFRGNLFYNQPHVCITNENVSVVQR